MKPHPEANKCTDDCTTCERVPSVKQINKFNGCQAVFYFRICSYFIGKALSSADRLSLCICTSCIHFTKSIGGFPQLKRPLRANPFKFTASQYSTAENIRYLAGLCWAYGYGLNSLAIVRAEDEEPKAIMSFYTRYLIEN